MACDQRTANVAVSRIVPVVLVGIVAYSCFAFTKPLCIDYLIRPASSRGSSLPRKDVAIGLLVGFYILLVLFLGTFLRLILAILCNPGYLPRGPQWAEQQAQNTRASGKKKGKHRGSRTSGSHQEKREHAGNSFEAGLGGNLEKAAFPFDASGLEAFYTKDVFVCEMDGKPPWCSTCCQYKTDRAHHCSEVGRCVRKMDHFCPWVGGVVSETSFKFFIQFLFYGALFAVYNLVTMAIFVAELAQKGDINIHYILILALSGVLGLFSFIMIGSSLEMTWSSSSTIENLTRRTKVWTLAVLIPRPRDFFDAEGRLRAQFPTVSYPEATRLTHNNSPGTDASENSHRVFAILHTKPGENPFDLGSGMANLQEVMGYTFAEWFVPLKHSPCADHGRQESAYPLGPVVRRLKREAGLEGPDHYASPRSSHDRKRKRRGERSRSDAPGTERRDTSRTRRHRHHRHRRHRYSQESSDPRRTEPTLSQDNRE